MINYFKQTPTYKSDLGVVNAAIKEANLEEKYSIVDVTVIHVEFLKDYLIDNDMIDKRTHDLIGISYYYGPCETIEWCLSLLNEEFDLILAIELEDLRVAVISYMYSDL